MEKTQSSLNLIDTDAKPSFSVPKEWTVEKHLKDGEIIWNPDNFTFYVSPYQVKAQKDEKIRDTMNAIFSWCMGEDILRELSTRRVLNVNALEFLLTHQELIPDAWKTNSDGVTNRIYFWGTIYHTHENANTLKVLYLYWNGEKWVYGDDRLLNNFDGSCVALIHKNPIVEKFSELVGRMIINIFDTYAPDLNSKVSNLLKEQSNTIIDTGTQKRLWLEISYIGAYILQQRLSDSLSAEEKITLGEIFRDAYSRYSFTIIPEESKSYASSALNDTDARIKIQKTLLQGYDSKLKTYTAYRGDIILAFKKELREAFNHNSSKINFANNILHKIRLNLSDKPISKDGGKLIFPDSLLTKIATDIVQAFRKEDIEK